MLVVSPLDSLNSTPLPAQRIYRPRQLAHSLGISLATLWRWSKNGTAPPIIEIGPGVSGGRASDWDQFLADPVAWRAARQKAVA